MPAQRPPPAADLPPLEATRELLDVSVTERGQFRTCRRRWHLETIENLEPRGHDELPFEFGSAIHAALEAYYRLVHTSKDRAREAARAAFQARWFDYMKANAADELWEQVLDLDDLGQAMLEAYFEYDEVSRVQLGKPMAVEGEIIGDRIITSSDPCGYGPEADVIRHESGRLMVPIVHPDTKAIVMVDGRVAYLTARIDLLAERKTPKKGLWVIDHKSASSAPPEKGLEHDDQATGYCYVVWRWLGLIPRGCVWNTLIKAAAKEPRMVKGKKKSDPDLVLSTAKDQQTLPSMYREALKANGLMSGNQVTSPAHADCLAALLARGWDSFFRRYEPSRNESEIASFEYRLYHEYMDMLDVKADVDMIYPNPSTRWCPGCSVRNICLAMEDGSDVEDIIEHNFQEAPDRKAKK